MARFGAFRVAFLVAALATFAVATDQVPDYHVSNDPAQRLFRASPFAHGYIHGYEVGFGIGNEDLLVGRSAQDVRKNPAYKKASEGYRPDFGNRESFRAGFREGLAVGYRDAFGGGEFRALSELRRLATGLGEELSVGTSDRFYDGGFLAGYRAARQEGGDECQKAPSGRERFCSGFLDGFELGESDTGAATTAREGLQVSPVLLPRPTGRSYPRR